LALAIHDRLDVRQQLGQVFLTAFTAARRESIETRDTGSQFVQTLANGAPVPTKHALGSTLAFGSQQTNRSCHEQASITTLKRLNASLQVVLDSVRQFHENGSSVSSCQSADRTILWDDYFSGFT
jgi:ABC-type sulfate transport system substrate-binding protein